MVLWWGVRGLALLQADILFGLGVALGKEEVMSKVDLEDEQEVDTEKRGKEWGLGRGVEESAWARHCDCPVGGWGGQWGRLTRT